MSFTIVTDSSANLSEEMIKKFQIQVLSLSFFVEETEYLCFSEDNVTDLAFAYQQMREKKPMRTSLVNSETADALFHKLLSEGNDILYIGFSSGLSGTYQSVANALADASEQYPERKTASVDTLAAALGQGLLVYYAALMREKGESFDCVYQWLMEHRTNLCHWFTVDDLFFLKRGGRISAASAFLGTALQIKPVLHVDDEGHLILMEKVRGRKKSLDRLVEHMQETVSVPSEEMIVFISHGDCREDADYVAKKVEELYHPKEIFVRILDPVIGTHSGPGTVALFYYGSKR